MSSKRGHILWNVTTKKNLLLLLHTISHLYLLIRLRKGMFRFLKKEFSPSGYIRSDAKSKYFKEFYLTYLSEAPCPKIHKKSAKYSWNLFSQKKVQFEETTHWIPQRLKSSVFEFFFQMERPQRSQRSDEKISKKRWF